MKDPGFIAIDAGNYTIHLCCRCAVGGGGGSGGGGGRQRGVRRVKTKL